MPFTGNRGVRIYWEEEGAGEPLLLIMGLGFGLAMWRNMRPAMAAHFRTVLFDNRGVGASSVPLRPWTMADMARDAGCVLDAAGIDSAHVVGLSMGGMIAQEFAISQPGRVRRLVLGCTWAGRSRVMPSWKIRAAIAPNLFRRRDQRLQKAIPLLYDRGTPRERIEEDVALLKQHPTRLAGYLGQIGAIVRWHSYGRLPQIQAPTLVVHGENDLLVPPDNGVRLAGRIPGAKLSLIGGAGHIFPTDQPEHTYRVILEFLKSR